MYRNILVPLDGSTFGEYALPLALTIARKAGAAIQLIHVHPPLALGYLEGAAYIDESLEEHARKTEQAYLDQTARKLRDIGKIPVTTSLVVGPVSEAIEQAAANLPADLVVLTTHGRGALGRFWLGSTTDALIRHLSIPMLLTRPQEGTPDLTREVELKRMIVALDGTPWAENMLTPAMELGRALELEFELLRVIQPPTPYSFQLEGGSFGQMATGVVEQIEAIQKRLREEAEDYLLRVADQFRLAGLRVSTKVLIDTQPGAAILAEGDHPGKSMLALETHGRGGLTRLLLGSTTDKVVRGAHVPVLVHHPVK